MNSDKIVEAIEEGRIVKVTESYARREGLVILRKPEIEFKRYQTPSYLEEKRDRERTKPLTEFFRKKPDWKEKQVLSELVDNFHWQIRFSRRQRGLTRKQLAKMLNVPEEEVQIIETGRLPSNDFVLINKIQKTLGLNLRKDGKDFDVSVSELMGRAKQTEKRRTQERKREGESEFLGRGIEILDEEI